MEAKLELAKREDYYAVKDAAIAKIEAIRKDLGV